MTLRVARAGRPRPRGGARRPRRPRLHPDCHRGAPDLPLGTMRSRVQSQPGCWVAGRGFWASLKTAARLQRTARARAGMVQRSPSAGRHGRLGRAGTGRREARRGGAATCPGSGTRSTRSRTRGRHASWRSPRRRRCWDPTCASSARSAGSMRRSSDGTCLNGAGVCGASSRTSASHCHAPWVALLARTAGLLGQLAEEQRRPIGMDAYLSVDRHATYVPPEDPRDRPHHHQYQRARRHGRGRRRHRLDHTFYLWASTATGDARRPSRTSGSRRSRRSARHARANLRDCLRHGRRTTSTSSVSTTCRSSSSVSFPYDANWYNESASSVCPMRLTGNGSLSSHLLRQGLDAA